MSNICLVADNAIQIGDRHTSCSRQLLGQYLVINARVQMSRVQRHNKIRIALIQPKHTGFFQTFRRRQHQFPASALKRVSSVNR